MFYDTIHCRISHCGIYGRISIVYWQLLTVRLSIIRLPLQLLGTTPCTVANIITPKECEDFNLTCDMSTFKSLFTSANNVQVREFHI